MKFNHRALAAAFIVTAAVSSLPAAALAIPPEGTDPIIRCPRGYHLEDGDCVKNTPPTPTPTPTPPPPPANSAQVTLDLARQSVDKTTIRVTGAANDNDAPTTPLTVQVRVDGTLVRSLVANLPGKRYDTTVGAAAGASQVCVTALNIGPTGNNGTTCKTVDKVKEFEGRTISYDVAHAQIISAELAELDRVTNTNATTVQQSTTISGTKSVADKSGWKDTQSVSVKMSGEIGIPFISDFKVEVAGSLGFEQNGEVTTTRTFTWQQPVLVPAKSKVVASVGVTKTQLEVPYAITGDYVYFSGFRVEGQTFGTYSGINGHDLEVKLTQFNLDGTPAARPADQPEASLLAMR